MGDDLKKVSPGDPLRIPARTYNRFIDVARAQQEGQRLFGRMPGSDAPRANVAHAYNASGQAVPMHGVVDLVEPNATESQLEFVKPGSGSGAHGIALEPIAPGALGLVALSGGVYEALVSGDAAPGDRLKPAGGSWHLEKGAGVFQAVADPKDGLARVVFAPGDTFSRLYEVTAVDTEAGTCTVRRPLADGELDEASGIADVLYETDRAPAVGDRGEVVRLAEGEVYFHPGGLGIEIRDDDPATEDLYEGRVWYNTSAS